MWLYWEPSALPCPFLPKTFPDHENSGLILDFYCNMWYNARLLWLIGTPLLFRIFLSLSLIWRLTIGSAIYMLCRQTVGGRALTLKDPWHENLTLWGFLTNNMSSPSLPHPPVAKTCVRCKTSTRYPARLWKNGSSGALIWNVAPYVVIRGQAPPLSLPCPLRDFGPLMRQWATTVRASQCVWLHTL